MSLIARRHEMSSSDEDLEPARHMAANSRQELATLWVKAQPVVAAFIASVVRDSHRTDDLLQEVARISAMKFEEYDSSRPFTSWVLVIARFEVLRYRRSQGLSKVLFSDTLLENLVEDLEDQSEQSEDRRRALRNCLEDISGRRRLVLEMRYQRDLQPLDIAERLGITSNAVLLLLHRTRRILADCISRRLLREGH
jgi:RNA polymerase sigma-70 factor (ECF subfamily)